MTGFHWIGLMAAVVAALLVTGVIGLVRICLEVEQAAPEDRPERDYHPEVAR